MDEPMTNASALQTLEVDLLGIRILIRSDAPGLLSEIHRRFGACGGYARRSGPVELTVLKDADRFRVRLEGREERLRLSERWPRLDDLVQMIAQRERLDLAFVHGACIAAQDSAALLFGSSTAGKTTLGLALRQYGFHLLAEDTTPLSLQTGLVYPFRTGLNLRPHTARLASEQAWECDFEAAETGAFVNGVPLRWIVHITPETRSRISRIETTDFAEWDRFWRIIGAARQQHLPAEGCELPVRTEADFERAPELAPLRQSNATRELLRHTYLPHALGFAAALQSATALTRRTQCARLVPGQLTQTADVLRAWMLSANPADR